VLEAAAVAFILTVLHVWSYSWLHRSV